MRFKLSEDFIIDTDQSPWNVEGLRICLFGGPGSGKSWNSSLFAEQFLDQGGTVTIFQPRDEYYTLKEKWDLLSVGGVHAKDIDFIPTAPATYAKGIVAHGISMIFYTTDVENEEKLVDFTSRLINYILKYQERHKRPLMIILEECQEYCPKSPRGRIVPSWIYARMIKAFKDCFLQGRKLNVVPIACSQRPQEVNFTIRQLANITFYGKFAPQDIAYIDRECLKWYRERGLRIRANELLDISPPRWLVITGDRALYIDVTAKRLTKHGAETPKLAYIAPRRAEVRKTISQLASEIKKVLERERLEESELEKYKRKVRELEKQLGEANERIKQLETALMAKKAIEVEVKPIEVPVTTVPKRLEPTRVVPEILRNIPSYEQRIYEYLSKYPSLEFTRYQIATALRLGSKSSRLTLALSRLIKLGLIEKTMRNKFKVK